MFSIGEDREKERARYIALRKQAIAQRKTMVRSTRKMISKSMSIARGISPQVARLLGRASLLLGLRAALMSPAARRRFIMAQTLMLKLIKRIASGDIPATLPRRWRRILSRSQIKLLIILAQKQRQMMEEVANRENHAINRARIINARPDIEIDTTGAQELTDFARSRLRDYQQKLEDSKKRVMGKWANLELDRFKANIEYSRRKARSLWASSKA